MSAACGEPYASDDNIAIANGHAGHECLEAAPAAEYEALVAAVQFYGIPVGDGQGRRRATPARTTSPRGR